MSISPGLHSLIAFTCGKARARSAIENSTMRNLWFIIPSPWKRIRFLHYRLFCTHWSNLFRSATSFLEKSSSLQTITRLKIKKPYGPRTNQKTIWSNVDWALMCHGDVKVWKTDSNRDADIELSFLRSYNPSAIYRPFMIKLTCTCQKSRFNSSYWLVQVVTIPFLSYKK